MFVIFEALKFLINPMNWSKILSVFGWLKSGVSAVLTWFQKKQIADQAEAEKKNDAIADNPKNDLATRAKALCEAEKTINPDSTCDKPNHTGS